MGPAVPEAGGRVTDIQASQNAEALKEALNRSTGDKDVFAFVDTRGGFQGPRRLCPPPPIYPLRGGDFRGTWTAPVNTAEGRRDPMHDRSRTRHRSHRPVRHLLVAGAFLAALLALQCADSGTGDGASGPATFLGELRPRFAGAWTSRIETVAEDDCLLADALGLTEVRLLEVEGIESALAVIARSASGEHLFSAAGTQENRLVTLVADYAISSGVCLYQVHEEDTGTLAGDRLEGEAILDITRGGDLCVVASCVLTGSFVAEHCPAGGCASAAGP